MRRSPILILCLLLSVWSCADSLEKSEKQTVSSGEVIDARRSRSELATLMRNLYNDLQGHRDLVKSGQKPATTWLDKYAWVKEAEPTDAEDSGPVFEAFSDGFINALREFERSEESAVLEEYNDLVNSCIGCHQQYCIGPLEIIKKLEIKN
jgi:hypothetical protein